MACHISGMVKWAKEKHKGTFYCQWKLLTAFNINMSIESYVL